MEDAVCRRIVAAIRSADSDGLQVIDITRCVAGVRVEREGLVCEDGEAAERGWSRTPFGRLHLVFYRLLPVVVLLFALTRPLLAVREHQPCLVDQFIAGHWSLPRADCQRVCVGIDKVIEFNSSDFTQTNFMENYSYTSKPLLIKGAASSWPATNIFSSDYFKQLYQKWPEAIDRDTHNGLYATYKSRMHNIKQFLQNSSSEKDWYISWRSSDPRIKEEIMKHLRYPSFIPDGVSELKYGQLYMGTTGAAASVHLDYFSSPVWQAQLSGIKTWSLFPHPECEQFCSPINITAHPGDIVYVDTHNWYHSTYVQSDNTSISFGCSLRVT